MFTFMRYSLLGVLILALGLSACGPKPRTAVGIMDTPEHHFKLGMSYIDSGDLDNADQEFQSALELDRKFGPAIAGKGLVLAYRGDAKESLKMIKKGQQKAEGKEQRLWTLTAEIRAYATLAKQERISAGSAVDKARKVFANAKLIDPRSAAVYYYMGEVYVYALDFDQAENMFVTVKTLKNGYEEEADKLWRLIQKANRAAPGTAVGKKIALVDKLSRADMAALLVEELNARRFYSRTEIPTESSFESPQSSVLMSGDELYTEKGVTDIKGHPMQGDIREAMELGIKGLQPYPDHTFRPQEPLSRAEVTMIFEDVIIRATGRQELATKFIGQESPFPDVRGDHPYFNAVMLCTSRGLMEADLRNGLFKPLDPVPGVDALEAIMRLKNQLSLF